MTSTHSNDKAQPSSNGNHVSTTANATHETNQKRSKNLVGIKGWLAFFVAGLGLSAILIMINLASYSSVYTELMSAQDTAPDYVAAMTPLLWFEILANLCLVGLIIWLIVLMAKHRMLARKIAIVVLIANAIVLTADYFWASSVFDAFNLSGYVDAEIRKAARDVVRSILALVIWVPYFYMSRRVKATLTK
ncbi:DUF2569 domain-containing protein [Candidatus Saccharibacteria bacterium]|jgi:hypothetical protein|nr:DUF2569 domain-containing protein [Candidatus Saccharibacteria bacterium]